MEIFLFLLGFCVWFSVSYALILLFIIWLSGFYKLAKLFSTTNEELVQPLYRASLKLGNAFFNESVLLGLYTEGIYIKFSAPFSLLVSQTLFIPWVEAKVMEAQEKDKDNLTIEISYLKIKLSLPENLEINKKHFQALCELVDPLCIV
ncbi:MAG: hypothetical protein SFU25_04550 [Candidatus Caenarcaniphilales bacterium]|nr:hypothetical protein [Candidatus Caenarcaniphilales bacterium]